VIVIEYGDFECPHCKKAVGAVKLLMARFGDHVCFALRSFPLEGVHPHALLAAEAAECAAAQGKFWPMHDLLFDRQSHLEPARLIDYAQTLDLDMASRRGLVNSYIAIALVPALGAVPDGSVFVWP
jgi:protein-disulfide isomerase